MRRLMISAVMAVVMIAVGGCIFDGSDKNNGLTPGWKSTAVPTALRQTWYYGNGVEIKITSKHVTRYNREWAISRCEKNGSEYRLVAFSYYENIAYFFKDVTTESLQYTIGYPTRTEYDAVTLGHGDYVTLTSSPVIEVE
jgi:hypothetical protein